MNRKPMRMLWAAMGLLSLLGLNSCIIPYADAEFTRTLKAGDRPALHILPDKTALSSTSVAKADGCLGILVDCQRQMTAPYVIYNQKRFLIFGVADENLNVIEPPMEVLVEARSDTKCRGKSQVLLGVENGFLLVYVEEDTLRVRTYDLTEKRLSGDRKIHELSDGEPWRLLGAVRHGPTLYWMMEEGRQIVVRRFKLQGRGEASGELCRLDTGKNDVLCFHFHVLGEALVLFWSVMWDEGVSMARCPLDGTGPAVKPVVLPGKKRQNRLYDIEFLTSPSGPGFLATDGKTLWQVKLAPGGIAAEMAEPVFAVQDGSRQRILSLCSTLKDSYALIRSSSPYGMHLFSLGKGTRKDVTDDMPIRMYPVGSRCLHMNSSSQLCFFSDE